MKLVNGSQGPMYVLLEGRPPTIQGATEMRWPPKGMTFEAGVPMDVSDREGGRLLERWEREGLVEVKPEESVPDAIHRGKVARLTWLTQCIRSYREQQAVRRAQNLEISLPKELQRQQLREIQALQKELEADDPVLNAPLPNFKPELIKDPLADELRAFGLLPAASPMSPGQDGDMLEI